jgi:hypothetical protein
MIMDQWQVRFEAGCAGAAQERRTWLHIEEIWDFGSSTKERTRKKASAAL